MARSTPSIFPSTVVTLNLADEVPANVSDARPAARTRQLSDAASPVRTCPPLALSAADWQPLQPGYEGGINPVRKAGR